MPITLDDDTFKLNIFEFCDLTLKGIDLEKRVVHIGHHAENV